MKDSTPQGKYIAPAVETGYWDKLIANSFIRFTYESSFYDDLMQEGRIAVIDILKKYNPANEMKAKTLVYLAAHSAAVDFLNDWNKHLAYDIEILSETHMYEKKSRSILDELSTLHKIELETVIDYLKYKAEASDIHKALLLRVVHSYSPEEIADSLGCTVGTAKAYVYRGRKDLLCIREELLELNKIR